MHKTISMLVGFFNFVNALPTYWNEHLQQVIKYITGEWQFRYTACGGLAQSYILFVIALVTFFLRVKVKLELTRFSVASKCI